MLSSKELRFTEEIKGTACQPLAPVFKPACNTCCPDPCGSTCEPKVRLKDYIRLKPSIAQTCFKIGEDTCEAEVMPAHQHCFTAKIRRRGACECLLTLRPIRATLDGAVCFAWGEAFWKLGDGQYEMDITFNGTCCLTAGLNVIGCYQAILGYEHSDSDACAVIPYCAPQVEDEPYVDTSDCGGPCA